MVLGDDPVDSVALSPDGSTVAMSSMGTVSVYDLMTGEEKVVMALEEGETGRRLQAYNFSTPAPTPPSPAPTPAPTFPILMGELRVTLDPASAEELLFRAKSAVTRDAVHEAFAHTIVEAGKSGCGLDDGDHDHDHATSTTSTTTLPTTQATTTLAARRLASFHHGGDGDTSTTAPPPALGTTCDAALLTPADVVINTVMEGRRLAARGSRALHTGHDGHDGRLDIITFSVPEDSDTNHFRKTLFVQQLVAY
jgi:hypothetical protein